ncbi:proton-conducting transporter transmembrane domain-containing protein [Asaia platycodi]|uniref:proton-conducting transporter transmembrane domain-containing protein n=1 Tax=Asaia platycodi TaxID=610243 RepID=UPI0006865518|nr:proton-conducting transporter membrane subunit [Asaia platycodi]
MTGAVHFISFFLGLETLSLSLLGLIAFQNKRLDAGEAAMKYLLLSGVASATMVFGFALIYAETGSLRFGAPDLSQAPEPIIGTMGVILVLTGMFFKLSAVPFHLWLADVLEARRCR